jgi:putative transposase
MIASIPPKIAVAKFVGQTKAVSSMKYNPMRGIKKPFYWQEKYGAFSFYTKRLPNYVRYVEHQKEHHASKTTVPILERFEDLKPTPLLSSAPQGLAGLQPAVAIQ